MKPIIELGHLEQRVMDAMWKMHRGTVHEVTESLRQSRAYTTIMTTLDRLYKKGLLTRTREGRSFVYEPSMDRMGLVVQKTRHFWNIALAGNEDARPVLSCFVDTITDHDHAALDELEALIRKKRKHLK